LKRWLPLFCLLVASCTSASREIVDADMAIQKGCAAIRDRFHSNPDCSTLEARLNGDTWIIHTKVPPGITCLDCDGPYISLAKADGRVQGINIY
jgi:hypothetical protein